MGRAFTGTLLGVVLGLTWSAWRPLAQAEATLFFPASLVLRARAATPEPSTPSLEPVLVPNTAAWAEDLLTGKEAVETICKRIERSNSPDKSRILRSAVLLGEPGRVSVTDLPEARALLVVSADDQAAALALCEGLLAYLNFKTKIPLEDPEADQIHEVERRLREQERVLGRTLYSQFGFDTSVANPAHPQAQDLQDYQATVNQYRPLLRRQFLRETQTAANGPYFVVLEPPAPRLDRWRWLRLAAGGGLAGWLLGRLFTRRRPTGQEPAYAARSHFRDAANE